MAKGLGKGLNAIFTDVGKEETVQEIKLEGTASQSLPAS